MTRIKRENGDIVCRYGVSKNSRWGGSTKKGVGDVTAGWRGKERKTHFGAETGRRMRILRQSDVNSRRRERRESKAEKVAQLCDRSREKLTNQRRLGNVRGTRPPSAEKNNQEGAD